MLFNSWSFALFLPIVFIGYWLLRGKKLWLQNLLLLGSSYFFYACWDWRFLFLLIFSTLLDYTAALKISNAQSRLSGKIWLWASIGINLGFLGVFKYFNFFADGFAALLARLGWQVQVQTLQIILPIGISFYTFHGLSYIIDIYKKRIAAEKNLVTYGLFVSYFPLLVAGPIERATHLLPQLKKARVFNYKNAIDGVYLILWGLFKKMVIADSCAQYANEIFTKYEHANSLTLLLGAVYFSFQIYGDFSGYSDIAIGSSKLFGISLIRNFNHPYFSRDIAEFWRRWHISLSSWFRDYVYIPLGGSRVGVLKKIRNTFIIFLLSGFWHGANYTFIAWGLLHALYFMPLLVFNKNRTHLQTVAQGKMLPGLFPFLQMLLTFGLVTLGWVFFRSATVADALHYLANLFKGNFKGGIQYLAIERYSVELLLLLAGFVMVEWSAREHTHPFYGRWVHGKVLLALICIIVLGAFANAADFIYFQF